MSMSGCRKTPASTTGRVAQEVEAVIQRVARCAEGARHRVHARSQVADDVCRWRRAAILVFSGAEQSQPNYAQVLIEVFDKHDTRHLLEVLQPELNADRGADWTSGSSRWDHRDSRLDPVVGRAREHAPSAGRKRRRDPARRQPPPACVTTGAESFAIRLRTDPDKANLSARLNGYDVAASSAAAIAGQAVAVLRDGNNQIPIVARSAWKSGRSSRTSRACMSTPPEDRRVPLQSISSISYDTQLEKILRRNQFRTITRVGVSAAGVLPSEVLDSALDRLEALQRVCLLDT